MRYVVNTLIQDQYRYVVDEHIDLGDKAVLFTNNPVWAYIYCLYRNLRGS